MAHENQAESETGLPYWVYVDDDFLALEREKLFGATWHIVCHDSDIEEIGSYATLEFLGALIFLVRGEDGKVRGFRNICRHRAARLLDDPFGACSSRIVCPYHAWTYDLKGRLVGLPNRGSYDSFAEDDYSLQELPINSCGGFYFVSLSTNPVSFEKFTKSVAPEFEIYQTRNMKALGRISLRERNVNWKIAVENYIDAMHLPIAHKGLDGLLGNSYTLNVDDGAYHIEGLIQESPRQSLSAKIYRAYLPDTPHLPASRRRAWVYKMLWPNLAFDIYPDQIDFMQFIPIAPNRTLLREISYALPDDRREMRAARYLNWRINRQVNLEDMDIIERTQKGFETGDYEPGPYSRDEVCLRDFTQRIRSAIPISREQKRPSPEAIRSISSLG